MTRSSLYAQGGAAASSSTVALVILILFLALFIALGIIGSSTSALLRAIQDLTAEAFRSIGRLLLIGLCLVCLLVVLFSGFTGHAGGVGS